MKLRIKGNSIRLRLTQTETAQIGEKGCVESSLDLGVAGSQKFVYSLTASETATSPTVEFSDNKLNVIVPTAQADRWVNSDAVSIESDGSFTPNILIEKDFACLDVREGDDDEDTFPNPKAYASGLF